MKTNQTMHRVTLVATLLLLAPGFAFAGAASVSGAGGGAFTGAASFGGAVLTAVQFGLGIDIGPDGTAIGDWHMTLLSGAGRGVPAFFIEGRPSTGSVSETKEVTIGGLCSVITADRTVSEANVPFAITVGRDPQGRPTLRLTIGTSQLPAVSVNRGRLAVD